MALEPIETDNIMAAEGLKNNVKNNASPSTFDALLGGVSYGAGIVGPAVAEGFDAADMSGAATISSAAYNAAYDAAFGGSYLTTTATGTLGSGTSYATGGVSPSYLSTTDLTATESGELDLDAILGSTMQSQTELLGYQMVMNQETMYFQALSNAEKARTDSLKQAVSNFR